MELSGQTGTDQTATNSAPEPGTFFPLAAVLPFAWLVRCRKWMLTGLGSLLFLWLAGTASAQVVLMSPASAELVGANISVPGIGFPTGTISATSTSITVTPSAANLSPVSFAPGTISGSGSNRTLVFKLPLSLSFSQPYAATVCVAGRTTANVAFTTATCATITVNPTASISNVSPAAGQAGTTVSVEITGLYSHFGQATSVVSVSGSGVTVSGIVVPVGSTTQLTATFTIAANASPGSPPSQ